MRTTRRILLVFVFVLCAASWAQAQKSGTAYTPGRNLSRGGIGSSLVLLSQERRPAIAPTDAPLLKSIYVGEADKVIARTRYGKVTAQDLYLWLAMNPGRLPAHLLDIHAKAKTAYDRDLLAKEVRQAIDDFVFVNQVLPGLAPGEPCDPSNNLRAYFYSLTGYQLAYMLDLVLPQVKITAADQVKYLQEHRRQLVEAERFAVRYIMRKVDLQNDPIDKVDEVEAELRRAGERVAAGEVSFADAARELSEAPSAANGGEIPPFRRGELFFMMEETASSLRPGEVSDVFQGPGGLYILQLVRALPPDNPTLENPAQLKKVNEALTLQILKAQYALDTKHLFEKKPPLVRLSEWDRRDPDYVVGEVCDFRLTKCQFWMAYPEVETNALSLNEEFLRTALGGIVEREAMAQAVREAGWEGSVLLTAAKKIACNMARRDAYVDRLQNGLNPTDDQMRAYWKANPKLFTPMAMKRVVKVTMAPGNTVASPQDVQAEMERYLFGVEKPEPAVAGTLPAVDEVASATAVAAPAMADVAPSTGDEGTTGGGAGASQPASGGTAEPPWTLRYYRNGEPGLYAATGTPILPLGKFPKLEPSAMREKVRSYHSADFTLRYDDYGFIYLEDKPEIPQTVESVPVGGFSPVEMVGNAAVTYYIEDARRLPKPAFEDVKARVYETWRAAQVLKRLYKVYEAGVEKADISYTF